MQRDQVRCPVAATTRLHMDARICKIGPVRLLHACGICRFRRAQAHAQTNTSKCRHNWPLTTCPQRQQRHLSAPVCAAGVAAAALHWRPEGRLVLPADLQAGSARHRAASNQSRDEHTGCERRGAAWAAPRSAAFQRPQWLIKHPLTTRSGPSLVSMVPWRPTRVG